MNESGGGACIYNIGRRYGIKYKKNTCMPSKQRVHNNSLIYLCNTLPFILCGYQDINVCEQTFNNLFNLIITYM
jgi:hypothetical protein